MTLGRDMLAKEGLTWGIHINHSRQFILRRTNFSRCNKTYIGTIGREKKEQYIEDNLVWIGKASHL